MATLKDAGTLTSRLHELTGELHAELTEREVDFAQMVSLADEIRGHAEALSATFSRIDEALSSEINGARGDGSKGDG
jgi:hypothetical protein